MYVAKPMVVQPAYLLKGFVRGLKRW